MTSRHTSSDGAATSASARPLACSRTWKRGSAEDYALIFGGSGRTGPIASKNCAVMACQSSMQRSPPVHRRGSGACPDTRRSNKRCATTTSTHSVCPDSLPKLNLVEPPWYGPVCPVVGEGWHREVSPYPDLRPKAALHDRTSGWSSRVGADIRTGKGRFQPDPHLNQNSHPRGASLAMCELCCIRVFDTP